MSIEIKDIYNVFHIQEPWFNESCMFDENREQLDVYVTFREDSTFTILTVVRNLNLYMTSLITTGYGVI